MQLKPIEQILNHEDYTILTREDGDVLRTFYGYLSPNIALVNTADALEQVKQWSQNLDSRQRELAAYFMDRELPPLESTPSRDGEAGITEEQAAYWREVRARLT